MHWRRRAAGSGAQRDDGSGLYLTQHLRDAVVHSYPYSWAWLATTFASDHARALAAEFPDKGFITTASIGRSVEKEYRMDCCDVAGPGIPKVGTPELSPAWTVLLAELQSDSYRRALSDLMGVDLAMASPHIRLCRYSEGDFLGAHTDRPDKVLTQVIYFNDLWSPSDGGATLVMRSRAPEFGAMRIYPRLGSSIIFKRSPRSWHAVEPVTSHLAVRRSLLLHYARSPVDETV